MAINFEKNSEAASRCQTVGGPLTCHPPWQVYPTTVRCLPMPMTPNAYNWPIMAPFSNPLPPQFHSLQGTILRMGPPPPLAANRDRCPPPALCPSVPLPKYSNASFSVGYYVPPTVEPGDPYGGMEHKWKTCFELLFQNLPHVWTFGSEESNLQEWFIFKDMAKVRFSCQRCTHGWTSMNGLVLFHYCWDTNTSCGHIRFSLKGQKCKQCAPSLFETPMWYPEEVQKVMTNLYYEVAGCMYGLQTPPRIKNRRHGRPRAHHDANMCQGCHQQICLQAKSPHPFPY